MPRAALGLQHELVRVALQGSCCTGPVGQTPTGPLTRLFRAHLVRPGGWESHLQGNPETWLCWQGSAPGPIVPGRGEAVTSQHPLLAQACPPPGSLPLLLSRDVQGVHDEANRLRNLLGPDRVLLEFGLHRRLGDALLEQARGAEEATWPPARALVALPGTWPVTAGKPGAPETRLKGLTSNLLSKF